MQYRRLLNSNAPDFLLLECLKSFGLFDYGFDLIIELDQTVLESHKVKQEREQHQQKMNNLLKIKGRK